MLSEHISMQVRMPLSGSEMPPLTSGLSLIQAEFILTKTQQIRK